MGEYLDLAGLKTKAFEFSGFIHNPPAGTGRIQSVLDWLSPDPTRRPGPTKLTPPNLDDLRRIVNVIDIYTSLADSGQRPLVVGMFGFFNAGKSTLANNLLGEDCQKVSPLQCTGCIWLIHHPDHASKVEPLLQLGRAFGRPNWVMPMPCDSQFLKDHQVILVDTPGYGASNYPLEGLSTVEMEELLEFTRAFMPLCDLLLLCMNATAFMSDSDTPAIKLVLEELPEIPSLILPTRIDSADMVKWVNGIPVRTPDYETVYDQIFTRFRRLGAESKANGWQNDDEIKRRILPVAIPKNGECPVGLDELRTTVIQFAEKGRTVNKYDLHRHKFKYFHDQLHRRQLDILQFADSQKNFSEKKILEINERNRLSAYDDKVAEGTSDLMQELMGVRDEYQRSADAAIAILDQQWMKTPEAVQASFTDLGRSFQRHSGRVKETLRTQVDTILDETFRGAFRSRRSQVSNSNQAALDRFSPQTIDWEQFGESWASSLVSQCADTAMRTLATHELREVFDQYRNNTITVLRDIHDGIDEARKRVSRALKPISAENMERVSQMAENAVRGDMPRWFVYFEKTRDYLIKTSESEFLEWPVACETVAKEVRSILDPRVPQALNKRNELTADAISRITGKQARERLKSESAVQVQTIFGRLDEYCAYQNCPVDTARSTHDSETEATLSTTSDDLRKNLADKSGALAELIVKQRKVSEKNIRADIAWYLRKNKNLMRGMLSGFFLLALLIVILLALLIYGGELNSNSAFVMIFAGVVSSVLSCMLFDGIRNLRSVVAIRDWRNLRLEFTSEAQREIQSMHEKALDNFEAAIVPRVRDALADMVNNSIRAAVDQYQTRSEVNLLHKKLSEFISDYSSIVTFVDQSVRSTIISTAEKYKALLVCKKDEANEFYIGMRQRVVNDARAPVEDVAHDWKSIHDGLEQRIITR